MRRTARLLAATLVVLPLVLVLYGSLVEPRFILDVRQLDIELPRMRGDQPVTVAMISDLQIGMWFANTGMVERVVERTLEAQPDAVLIGGDFLYSNDPNIAVQIDHVLDLLGPLTASDIPMFAVLGNHDYAVGAADELETRLEEQGIDVLSNASAPVSNAEDADISPLRVVGIGPARPGLDDVQQALRDVPDEAPRIVLMHNPTSFPALPPDAAPFALAGHTHCGQIALPGTPRWSYVALTDEEALVADGFAPRDYGAEGNQMFVSCGIGFSRAPIRINAPPQLVLVELHAGG